VSTAVGVGQDYIQFMYKCVAEKFLNTWSWFFNSINLDIHIFARNISCNMW